MELQSVQQPKAKPIKVALNRVRKCPVPLVDSEEVVVEQANGEEDEDTLIKIMYCARHVTVLFKQVYCL